MKENKPTYGMDSPGLFTAFFVMGIVEIGFAIFLSILIDDPFLFWLFLTIFALGGCYSLLVCFWMVYSNQTGKKEHIQAMLNEAKLTGSEKILDLGCGSGRVSITAAKQIETGKVTAAYLSTASKKLAALQENIEITNFQDKIETKEITLTSLPFQDQFFDIVIAAFSLHKLKNPKEREKTIEEVERVLKPNGRFLILDFQNEEENLRILQKLEFQNVAKTAKSLRIFPPSSTVSAYKK